MKQKVPVTFDSFLGGVNQEVAASQIKDTEVSMGVNWKPRPPEIIQRGGLRKLLSVVAPNGASEPALGLKVVVRGGRRGLLVLGQTRVYFYDMELGYAVQEVIGTIGTSNALTPWSIAAWNDTILAARPEDGLWLIQFDPDLVSAAGIPAPTGTALTAVDSAAGVLTAGTYSYVIAFKDSKLGSIGSYGVQSNDVTIAANRSILVSNFPTPPSARLDTYVLYRTLPNGTAQWLKVAEFATTETDYLDNIPIAQQGALASATNTPPVADAASVGVWNGRVWIHDGDLLYPSLNLNPEAFPASAALEVGQDDNEDIVEILATKLRLIVGKRRTMWWVMGTGATSWDIKSFDLDRGMIARRALTEYAGLVLWASEDDFYASDGVGPGVPLSGSGRRKLRPFFKERTVADSLIALPIPSADGVLFGLQSTAVTRELLQPEEELVP